jgi:hypothetical protein
MSTGDVYAVRVARRVKNPLNSFQATLSYYDPHAQLSSCTGMQPSVVITEDSECVDGIGGITWEGSLLLAYLLQQYDLSGQTLVELGGGAGLVSLALVSVDQQSRTSDSYNGGVHVVCTDRVIDLAVQNMVQQQQQQGDRTDAVSDMTTLSPQSQAARERLTCLPLTWGCLDRAAEELHILNNINNVNCTVRPDIIFGAEVACLRAQQPSLVQSIIYLAGQNTVVIMGFDEGPQPNGVTAERELDERMCGLHGYKKAVLCSSSIVWVKNDTESSREAYLVNFKADYEEEKSPRLALTDSLLCRKNVTLLPE